LQLFFPPMSSSRASSAGSLGSMARTPFQRFVVRAGLQLSYRVSELMRVAEELERSGFSTRDSLQFLDDRTAVVMGLPPRLGAALRANAVKPPGYVKSGPVRPLAVMDPSSPTRSHGERLLAFDGNGDRIIATDLLDGFPTRLREYSPRGDLQSSQKSLDVKSLSLPRCASREGPLDRLATLEDMRQVREKSLSKWLRDTSPARFREALSASPSAASIANLVADSQRSRLDSSVGQSSSVGLTSSVGQTSSIKEPVADLQEPTTPPKSWTPTHPSTPGTRESRGRSPLRQRGSSPIPRRNVSPTPHLKILPATVSAGDSVSGSPSSTRASRKKEKDEGWSSPSQRRSASPTHRPKILPATVTAGDSVSGSPSSTRASKKKERTEGKNSSVKHASSNSAPSELCVKNPRGRMQVCQSSGCGDTASDDLNGWKLCRRCLVQHVSKLSASLPRTP